MEEKTPIATLTFHLPENEVEFRQAIDGYKWELACYDLDNRLRSILKYNPDNFTNEQLELAEKLRDEFFEIKNGYNLSFSP